MSTPSTAFGSAGISGWRSIPLLICLITGCSPRGCVVSNFELASESRLPRWVNLPGGASRADVKMMLYYYSCTDVDNTEFGMSLPKGKTHNLKGKHWYHPRTLRALDIFYATNPRPAWPDPSYVVIKVNGVVDVIEHRRGEQNLRDPTKAVFWMTDNQEILKEAIEPGK